MQLVGLVLAFVVILVLVGRRVNLAACLAVGTLILAAASLMPPRELALSVFRGLTKPESVELILDVAAITSLAGVLKRYGLLDTMVRSVSVLLGGARLAIMAVPSLIGTMPVLGGAIISAPMVDGLGDRLGLGPTRKATVNLVFRHAWFFVAPFSPSLVLAAKLAGVPLGGIILHQVPYTAAVLAAGYLFLLAGAGKAAASRRRSTAGPGDETADNRGTASAARASAAVGRETAEGRETAAVGTDPLWKSPRHAVGPFIRSVSPLAVGVVLSLGLGGVSLPLYLSVGLGLVLALYLSRRHPDFRSLGLPTAVRSIQWRIVVTMASVMVFGQVMEDSGTAAALVQRLAGSGLPTWVLVVALPLLVGYVAGAPAVPVGVSFPVLMPLALPGHSVALASALYCVGFTAYFVSPLHLCQVLSSQYFGVTIPRLYRDYWPVAAVLAALGALYVRLALV